MRTILNQRRHVLVERKLQIQLTRGNKEVFRHSLSLYVDVCSRFGEQHRRTDGGDQPDNIILKSGQNYIETFHMLGIVVIHKWPSVRSLKIFCFDYSITLLHN